MKDGPKLEIVLAGQAVAAFRDERDLMETAPARLLVCESFWYSV